MVNPLDFTQFDGLISTESKEKYFRNWTYYVKSQEISPDKIPSRDSIFEYLKDCYEGEKNYAPSTLWTVFSCLNKFCQHLYDLDFSVSNI